MLGALTLYSRWGYFALDPPTAYMFYTSTTGMRCFAAGCRGRNERFGITSAVPTLSIFDDGREYVPLKPAHTNPVHNLHSASVIVGYG